jgi:hypothetical protein
MMIILTLLSVLSFNSAEGGVREEKLRNMLLKRIDNPNMKRKYVEKVIIPPPFIKPTDTGNLEESTFTHSICLDIVHSFRRINRRRTCVYKTLKRGDKINVYRIGIVKKGPNKGRKRFWFKESEVQGQGNTEMKGDSEQKCFVYECKKGIKQLLPKNVDITRIIMNVNAKKDEVTNETDDSILHVFPAPPIEEKQLEKTHRDIKDLEMLKCTLRQEEESQPTKCNEPKRSLTERISQSSFNRSVTTRLTYSLCQTSFWFIAFSRLRFFFLSKSTFQHF